MSQMLEKHTSSENLAEPRRKLLNDVRYVLIRDGVVAYNHICRELPGISHTDFEYIFRILLQEDVLITDNQSQLVHVNPALRIPRILAVPSHAAHPKLYAQIRELAIRSQRIRWKDLRKLRISPLTMNKILHHLRNEGILAKNPGKKGRWRVVVSLERARELGLISENTPIQIAAVPPPTAAPNEATLSDAEIIAELVELRNLFGKEGKAGRTLQASIDRIQRLTALEMVLHELVARMSVVPGTKNQ